VSPARTRRQFVADAGRASLAGVLLGPGTARAQTQTAPVPAPDLPAAGGWKDPDYWAFADWAMTTADDLWDESYGFYGTDIRTSCAMLSAHSIACQVNYTGGPTRNDARAKRMAEQLVNAPPFLTAPDGKSTGATDPHSSSQAHTPGWCGSPLNATDGQHVSIDPKVAEALSRAWLVRDFIGLSKQTADAIANRIQATAEGVFFLYPNMRLNQVNWYMELYVWAAVTAKDPDKWMPQFRRQLTRWITGTTQVRDPWIIPNLSPSWSFRRDPLQSLNSPQNIESNEYCCIILDALSYLPEAKKYGLVLTSDQKRVLKAWSKRAIPAYFTHSGYMNWDTGLYLDRWHLGRYWAWSLGGLFAIMYNDEQGDADDAQHAKWLFDRALATYTRWAKLNGSAVPQTPTYPVKTGLSPNPPDMAARFVFLATRAVWRNIEGMPVKKPPAMYAYDPGIGRLTITTRTYNTAIVAQSNGAFPYGGLDLCRLADADQRVAASIGGTGTANFGVIVSDSHGDKVVASAVPRTKNASTPPLTMTEGPKGKVTSGKKYPSSPYAGSFDAIEVTGARDNHGVRVRSTNRFSSDHIVCTWKVDRLANSGALDVRAHFPTYGKGAKITAVTTAGKRVALKKGDGAISLKHVAYLWLRSGSPETGYVVVPRRFPKGATTEVVKPGKQSSAPLPGPTLTIKLADGDRHFGSVELEVRIGIASSASQAASVAKDLGA
jgi:hypothetical protein